MASRLPARWSSSEAEGRGCGRGERPDVEVATPFVRRPLRADATWLEVFAELLGRPPEAAVVALVRPSMRRPFESLLHLTLYERRRTPPIRVRVGRFDRLSTEFARAAETAGVPIDLVLYSGPREYVSEVLGFFGGPRPRYRIAQSGETVCLLREAPERAVVH